MAVPAQAIPTVTAADTVDAIVSASKRQRFFPLRLEFLRKTVEGEIVPGPFPRLVNAGDRRALLLYLLLVTKVSAEPWDSTLPATVWARALGLPLPESKTARSTISKIWLRLERHGLVIRRRQRRLANVSLLREDGSGKEYTNPGDARDRYLRVPLALWQEGPQSSTERWYQVFTLPELAVLIIARSLSDDFPLPQEKGPEWYGISADTISRGLTGLKNHDLLFVNKTLKQAPLSPVGYTEEKRYTLLQPFGPVGPKRAPRSSTSETGTTSGSRQKVLRRVKRQKSRET